jgi:hypothetical protein
VVISLGALSGPFRARLMRVHQCDMLRLVVLAACCAHVAGFLLASQAVAGIDAHLRHRYPGAAGCWRASPGGFSQCLLTRAAVHRRNCEWKVRTLQMGLIDWRGTCHDDSGEGKLAKLCVPCAAHVANSAMGVCGTTERARAGALPL